MKKLVIAFAIVIMVAGGSIAALKTMQIGPFFVEDASVEAPVVKKGPSKYIDMDPLVIPIYQGNRVVSVIQIHLKLEAMGDDDAKYVKYMIPRLHDAFLRDLYDFIPRLILKGKNVDLVTIKSRLRMVGKRVVKDGQLENILIQTLVDNPSTN